MKLYRILIILLLLICMKNPGRAQTYRMESYNAQSGLLSDHINDIAQNDDGTIWIATTKGLSIFDGIDFKNFRDSNNLFPIDVTSRIRVVAPNHIVFAGFNLASHFVARYWNESKWYDLKIPDSLDLSLNRIWAAKRIDNNLYVKYINNNVLYSYSSADKIWLQKELPAALLNKSRKLVIRDRKTVLLSAMGIHEETIDGWKDLYIFNEAQQRASPADIFFDNDIDSTIWLGGFNWLSPLRKGELLPNQFTGKKSALRINQIQKSSNGFLFFRNEKSFYRYHILSNTFKSFIPILEDVGVINARILIDKENGLWITSYRGLHHIPSFLFSGFTKGKGLTEAEVSVISELAPDKYLVGLRNSYEVLDKDSVIFSDSGPNWRDRASRFINATKDKNNVIYVAGHQLGVGAFQTDLSFKWLPLKDTAIVLTRYLKDTLWAATLNGNLYYLKNNNYILKASLKDFPRSISLMNNGDLLVCVRNGVKIVSGSKIKIIEQYSDLSIKQPYCSFLYDNRIFLGTEGGLAILENDRVKKASINGKHIDRAIYSIIQGKEGIWFGTDNGVFLLQDTTLTHFDESNGLVGWEINRGAFMQDSKGRMVIGTNKGLNFYDPLFTENKSLYFEPTIKWIRANNKIFTSTDSIKLSYHENFVTIGLQAISHTGKLVEFRYRMMGYQNNWLYLSSSDAHEVTYRSLPYGEYRFEFQARLTGSSWSKTVKSQVIHIATPFYKSNLFYFLLFLVPAAIGYTIRWVFTNQKAKNKLEREIEKSLDQLRKSETKLELALENSKMGVWIYNFDLDRAEYSKEMFEILDISPLTEPLNKKNYLSIIHKADKNRVYKELIEALKKHKPYDVEFRITLRNGSIRWLHLIGKAVYKSNGRAELFSGTLNNISARKGLEEDRELIITELEKTNKELDRFIYSVSHDLSAPIKSIQGLINLTRMNQLSNDTQHYLTLIERSINRQNQFIKEIIEYGKNSRTQVEFETINIEEVINNTLEDLKYSEYYQNTEINLQIDQETKIVECDKIRIKIILNNLLSNAIKFKSKYRDKHIVDISVFKVNSKFGLTIKDNGIGIDDKHLDKLFTMFYRATDQQPGSGIGLYIAFEAAKKINMSLTLSSKFGEGSTFTLK
jgi:PAS domain S-box-containing protein